MDFDDLFFLRDLANGKTELRPDQRERAKALSALELITVDGNQAEITAYGREWLAEHIGFA